jgi:hypothetical protein
MLQKHARIIEFLHTLCCTVNVVLYSEWHTKEALEGLENFRIEGQIINTLKYADGLVLLAKEETVIQGMFDKLTEVGRCYGM